MSKPWDISHICPPQLIPPRAVSVCSTIWYELHAREWPYKNQPAEVIIWQVGSGMKPNLTQIGMGKEISVSVAHLQQTVPHLLTILNLTFI